MPYLFGDITFIFLIPALIFALYAQSQVSSTFQKYSRVRASSQKNGAQVARELLDRNGLYDIPVEMVRGKLSDHYDPKNRVLRLSSEVFQGASIAALGVAAHETGHAIQHDHGYVPLHLRSVLYPLANIGSTAAWPLFLIGLIFSSGSLMDLGIIFFTLAVLFQVITLPVEFNASSRAISLLIDGGYVSGNEAEGAKRVLNAAALTYVAATAMAIMQLLRLLVLRGSRD
jgi:hypothetical protein